MKPPLRVAWTEGLLMSPQHLQQHDRYFEGVMSSRLEGLAPLLWGIHRVELDRRALIQGQLSLLEFRGILPGGTHLHVATGDSELPAARPIAELFTATQKNLPVFLAVARERDGINNYAPRGGGPERYVLEHRGVSDAAGTGGSVTVALARKNVLFVVGNESRDDLDSIQIAEIGRDETGAFIVLDTFVPPCLRITGSPFLMSGLRRILGIMTTRQRGLSDSRRERDASSVEFVAQDVSRYLLMSTINTHLPVVNYYAETGDGTPRDVYLALSQLAGQLATFATDFDPLSLPKFNYLDLRSTYEELFARVTFLLQASIREHFFSWSLDARQDGLHLAQIADERLHTCGRFFIAVRSPLPEQQTATTLPRLCKVASWADINNILSAATPGAPVNVTFRPPSEISIKAGTLYFAVATDNLYWRNVLSERSIAVYLPEPFTANTTQVQLLGIPGSPVASKPA